MTLDGGIVRGGKVIPVIESRTQLAAHLRRDLEALGLERKVKDAHPSAGRGWHCGVQRHSARDSLNGSLAKQQKSANDHHS